MPILRGSAARPKQLDVLNTAAKRILLIIQFSMLNSGRGRCFASTIMRVCMSYTPENEGGSYNKVRKRFFFRRFFSRKAFITVNKQRIQEAELCASKTKFRPNSSADFDHNPSTSDLLA